MRNIIRATWNRLFTATAATSVVLMAGALVIILAPMIWRGAQAVLFRGTVEFRKMQHDEPLFNRGDAAGLQEQLAVAEAARRPVYEMVSDFSRGIDVAPLEDQARHLYRQLKRQLRNRAELAGDGADAGELVDQARELRDTLLEALESHDRERAASLVRNVIECDRRDAFDGTVGEGFFQLAERYALSLESVDPARREEYLSALREVKDIVVRLLGPLPGESPEADLAQYRYGATRWDQAQALLEELLWRTEWVAVAENQPLQQFRRPREGLFAGTELAAMFPYVRDHLEEMMLPQATVYWQYFIDDSTPGHYFGGVGPEILGTLLLTVLSMCFALPVGVMTAAYLIECTRGGRFTRVIRACINTLAGVPSIVFGLFGLALFIDVVQPTLGLESEISIFAGALTLAVLVLPIIIRASEEAIRAVPRAYKEASLSLGAGGLRTFLTGTFPAALPGILTGVILSMSRAAGETAPILFTAAVAYRIGMPGSIFRGGTRTLSYSSYDMAVSDRMAMDVPHNQYGMIMTLILLVLGLNIAAVIVRSRLSRKLRGQ